MDQATPTPPLHDRIDSWKSVAAFLGRDRRTVQRWEKDRGLPVHRIPGSNGTVFAFKTELKEWLQSVPADFDDTLADAQLYPNETKTGSGWRSGQVWIAVTGCLFLVLLIVLLYRHRQAPALSQTANSTAHGENLQQNGQISSPGHQPSVKAKELYLEGMFDSNRRTQDGLESALGDFKRAIAEDGDYAEAYVGLAQTYELIPEFGSMPTREAYPHAIEAAQRAVTLDPSAADAHRVLAFGLFYWAWNVPAAETEFRRSIELDPGNAETHHWYGNMLFTLRQIPQAEKEIQQAREMDTHSRAILADSLLIESTVPEKSEHSIAKLIELENAERDFVSPARYLSAIYLARGDYERYVSQLANVAALSHSQAAGEIAQAAMKGWKSAGKDGVNRSLRLIEEREFRNGHTSGYELALICMRLGDTDAGLRYLNAAIEAHDFFVLTLIHCYDTTVAPILGRPEFRRVLDGIANHINADGGGRS